MTDRVTYAQAAEILGCHVSNVPKLVRRGHLTSTRRREGALERRQVEQLAEARRIEQEARKRRTPKCYKRVDHRPDHDHDWLSPKQVAALLGVTATAVRQRLRRGRLPATESGGRWWIRRDLLEQVEAARLVRKTRQL
jgi:excisionase family DNA binding protein